MPDAWPYSARTGGPGVIVLCMNDITKFICSLSVAACTVVVSDPSLSCIVMLLGPIMDQYSVLY